MEDKTLKTLLSKLRQPIHISYISKYILKETENETEVKLNKLMDEGLIEESSYSKGYYVVRKENTDTKVDIQNLQLKDIMEQHQFEESENKSGSIYND